ncbi:Hpt domain-containing protein [Dokdonella sp.]|uniref:Hpt domain-containing protein n=1 Tax=Dokdonella sp. TaxID=2291710 RepID=UPI001B1F7185|nr:Hpt domain-containing protein [Dokdonella sp.]MBO9665127.1 Hpt domain-containing protein [Dokdonella sp.]
MKLHDDGDFTALNWIKPALDATLAQARDALERYVEAPADLTPMRECVTHLHQVQGTLRMVELYGAAMVVENMERLAEALVADTVRQRDEAYSVLMRGMVQLPDYLERLQSGHKDIPIVLLPLLNDLRACRGENLLSESALFSPDLSSALPFSAGGAAQPLAAAERRTQALRLRLGFQAALLKWFRDEGSAEHLNRLIDVLDRLRAISSAEPARRLWWIAAGAVEAVRDGGLDASVAVKLLFGRVDREIHRYATDGDGGFEAAPPRELTKNLLYYVAHSGADGASPRGPRGAEISRTYRLDTLLPTEVELQHAQGSMTGRNKNLLGTVSAAIKEDLLRVKEALDIFLRTRGADPGELQGQVEVLHRVGDTLGMLGLGVPRRVVDEQRGIVEEMAARQRAVDEGALLDVAGALLYVEASLDDHIERLGDAVDGSTVEVEGLELPKAEVRRILDALMREAAVNIVQAKHDIIAFIESPWDHARVGQIPRLLEEISGALRMLGLPDAAELMAAVVRFVEVELIAHRRVPTAEQMDKLADALASIEYYLEATREQRRNREKILDVARESLEALGYWPLENAPARPPMDAQDTLAIPPEPAVPAELRAAATLAYGDAVVPAESLAAGDSPLPSVELAPGRDLHDLVIGESTALEPAEHDLSGLRFAEGDAAVEAGWTEIEEEIEEEVPVEDDPLPGFQAAAGEDIDESIREIFVEEVDEEIANLRQQLPLWKRDVDNLDELKSVRRSFHTLKGSGRLVGARALGEFSWKIENLLNRVLDGTVKPSHHVVALVDEAIAAVPSLLGALRGERFGSARVNALAEVAERLSAGEDVALPEASATTRKVRRVVRRRVPLATSELPSFSVDVHGDEHLSAAFGAPVEELVAGPLPNVDPVLFDILQSEVAAHLGTIEDYLARCVPEPVRASEPLLRAVHTLNGAIAMVDIPPIGAVLAPLESYVKRLRGAAAAPDADGIAALQETIALTREVMQRLEAGRSDLPDSHALAVRVAALRDALPEPETVLALYGVGEASDGEERTAPAEIEPIDRGDVVEPTSAFPYEPPAPIAPDDESVADLERALRATEAEPLLHAVPIPRELIDSLADFDPGKMHAESTPAVADELSLEAALAELPPLTDLDVSGALDEIDARRADEPGESIRFDEVAADEDFDIERDDADATASDEAVVATEAAPPIEHESGESEDIVLASTPEDEYVEAHAIEDDLAASAEPLTEELVPPAAPSFADEAPAEAAAPAPAAPVRVELSGAPAAAIAEDAQPDGALEISDIDSDLLDIFAQEAADILDEADAMVAQLRESPRERAPIAGLQRELHTLKGGARMAGLAPIGDLSHAMESLVDALSEGRREVDRAAVESLERGFDRMHGLVQRVAHRRAIAMPTHAIAHFETLVAGEGVVAERLSALDRAAAAGPAEEIPAVQRPAPRHLSATVDDDAAHAPQEMIRVRSDLLDSLVNYAGEVSIYRSRLEQQISTFRFNLVEFDQTVTRLRDQLRKLEIETEAQIIARYQREHDQGVGAFDPLELDRFSQLQQLSRALSESVSDLTSIQGLLDEQTRQSETLLLQQSRVNSDLQEGLMRTRMVPFDSLVPNLRRTLRQAAQETNRRVQLKVDGAHGEMDRNLLERMKAPFEHMLRNALAHGIEAPEERVARGKPAEGTVNIALSRESTEVVLRVADDGRGMDREAIRRKAVERGLLNSGASLSDRDLYAFVLESGFSTASQVTQLAGRGVGMDVVHNEIKQLGGSLAIDSTPGQGTAFTIRLPFTLAVTQAILVKLGEASYAIPMSSVQGVARIAREDLERRIAAGDPKHVYAGEEYVIHDLAQLLGLPRQRAGDDTQVPLLMTRSGDQRAAVRIDGVVGSREIVVKSVGPQLSSVPGIFGATIMGDGAVVIILDLAPLVRRLSSLRARLEAGALEEAPAWLDAEIGQAPETRQKPLVMVVDDSITMRKVTTRVLERADLDVVTAKDGLDALEKLQDNVPDLMLLDIEMPRMDGYELATYMRNDPRTQRVPIIMITSRTGEKHRQRALEIGVERYLGKPYQEDELLRHVQEILRRDHV